MRIKTMPVETLTFYGFASLSILCQMAGYAGMGGWIWMIAGMVLAALWLLSRKFETRMIASLALTATVGLAITGIALGCSGWLLIASAAFGLAAWDILMMGTETRDSWDDCDWQSYRDSHLKTCLLVVVGGLLFALLGRQINFQIPFVVMIGLVITGVFILNRVWRNFKISK
jgi:hypothetical protein